MKMKANKLLELREDKNLTQADIAKTLNVKPLIRDMNVVILTYHLIF